MSGAVPSTLPQLLLERSQDSTAEIGYLDSTGQVKTSISFLSLYEHAQEDARRLLCAGLKGDGKDIVLTEFADYENHVRIFWACCLAGIPFCPLPPLHPDRVARQTALDHLQSLFDGPTLLADDRSVSAVKGLLPEMKTISLSEFDCLPASDEDLSADIFPVRTPLPDEIACLMLTSGSTGNSKAVALRHSNILSSIRGKIKHHGTSSSSRFFNWVALHHVASFTEVHFHALEANASQYHVSPMAVIQRPINLLQWCSELKITYTFSPNFLLAQLCRDVSTDPSTLNGVHLSNLKVFISGGEAVPVKTAVEFASILEQCGAPRDSLRAGFGMTETGAGCIYDRRAVLTDVNLYETKYLSLGTCCDGTIVRVIEPNTGRSLGPNEVGQLQLSGPTVFREYYNNPEATAKSFTVDGWFITGDQAQIDADGNLHMVGRDTDYVNINGVKHPSVDVEHYIEDSDIDGVVRSYVFVCPLRLPNAATETYCVFYKHSASTENDLPEAQIKSMVATNAGIKKACSVFCSLAPHAIVPLPGKTFVKTALGKVSRTALARAYLGGKYSQYEEQIKKAVSGYTNGTTNGVANGSSNANGSMSSTVIDRVSAIISTIFGISHSDVHHSLNIFDAGASSMQFIQLKHLLEEGLGIQDLPMIDLLKHPEVGTLSEYLAQLLSKRSIQPNEAAYDPLVCLHLKGSKPPLFIFHPFHGEILGFVNLARSLDDNRPVYALRARGFGPKETPFSSFEEMVITYTASINSSYPSGPFVLAGYSLGGAIAFEVAKRLEQMGKAVSWVGVLDLPPFIKPLLKPFTWIETLLMLCTFLSLTNQTQSDNLREEIRKQFPECIADGGEPASATKIVAWLWTRFNENQLQKPHLNPAEFERWAHVAFSVTQTGKTYRPAGELRDGFITVFRAATSLAKTWSGSDNLSVWKEFCDGRFEIIDVGGEHHTMLAEENILSFAGKMRKAIKAAEN